MLERTFDLEGIDCEIPRWPGRRAHIFIRVWKLLPNRHVLKTLRAEAFKNVEGRSFLKPSREM